ncbi:MAG: diacylglycerol kinase [Desulfocapsaceae bacterium]|jgi:diacylglycerol kinase (ATP)|nr:diacylglycerol kinase [Desulfocapsaceae bacterium]
MEGEKKTGLRRVINATGYSLCGLKSAWQTEAAFRQEVLLMAIMLPLAFLLGKNGVERALLISVCLVVLVAELLNSAIEAVVDRIGLEHHPLAGAAKDLGSAAVFVSLVMVVMVWGLVLFDSL